MSAGHAPERPAAPPTTTPPATGPILAPGGASAAQASRPDEPLDSARFHVYEGHPAPWWVAAIWVAFFIFAVAYLITNLMR